MEQEENGFDIDPEIAAAMGFASFGTTAGKKRKHHQVDLTVTSEIAKEKAVPKLSGTNSNRIPLGQRQQKVVQQLGNNADQNESGINNSGAGHIQSIAGSGPSHRSSESHAGQPTLEMLRRGVQNERGDMKYFLPSFLEDPWEGLKPQ